MKGRDRVSIALEKALDSAVVPECYIGKNIVRQHLDWRILIKMLNKELCEGKWRFSKKGPLHHKVDDNNFVEIVG